MILRREAVHDEMAQMDAFSLLVPNGWKVESDFRWNVLHVDPVHPMVRVFNPNGLEAINYYGGNWAFMDWSRAAVRVPDGSNTYGFTALRRFTTPADFITKYGLAAMRQELQAARLVNVTEMPKLVAPSLAKYGNRPGLRAAVNRMRFDYAVEGRPVQEDVYCTLYADPPAPSGAVTWSAEVVAFRAEKGKIDDTMSLLLAIKSSVRENPQWSAVIGQVARIVQEISVDGSNQEAIRARIREVAAQKLARNILDRSERAQAASIQTSERWDQVIRGVETRVSPIDQKPIEVPAGYSNVWINPLNEIILSNDPNYTPNSVNGIPRGVTGGGFRQSQRPH